MRKHLIKYFEEHMIQPFPVISTRRTGSAKLINIGVYTVIADVWMMELIIIMVHCVNKECKEWFHHVSAASTPDRSSEREEVVL